MPARDVLRLRAMLDSPDAAALAGLIQPFPANGTVDINGGPCFITNAGATTLTIPPPVAGGPGVGDDGKVLEVFATTAFAHVLSFGANKLNGNKTSYTWTKAAVGYMARAVAFNGVWWIEGFVADAAAYAQQVTLA